MIFKNEKNELILNKGKKESLSKHNYLLLVDVETCNDNKIILDFSYMIISTKTGLVVERNCYLIKESWETKSIINGVYSKPKIKDYRKMLKENKATIIDKQHLYNKLNKLIKTYNLKIFMAYNGAFDLEALYNTFDYSNKKTKWWQFKCWRKGFGKPLFKTMDLLDLWTYASVYYHTPHFKKWYDKNIGVYSDKGNRKTNAEIMYKYLKENKFLIETHLAQEDLDIEYQIFMACVWKRSSKVVWLNRKGLYGAWKLAQNNVDKKSKTYQELVLYKALD